MIIVTDEFIDYSQLYNAVASLVRVGVLKLEIKASKYSTSFRWKNQWITIILRNYHQTNNRQYITVSSASTNTTGTRFNFNWIESSK